MDPVLGKVTTLTAWLSDLPGYRIAELEGSDPRNSHKRKKTLLKRAAEIETLAHAEGVEITIKKGSD